MKKSNIKLIYKQRCYGKKICYTKKEAETLVNFLKKRGKRGLRIYECDKGCGKWHITHQALIAEEEI
jgi:PII-like signaling protein